MPRRPRQTGKKRARSTRAHRGGARGAGSQSDRSLPMGKGNGQARQIRASNLIGGFPDEMDVTLRYTEYIGMSSTVAPVYYVFRGNDTFDPNFTGTGAQPAYRDNWAGVYTTQQVVASSIRVVVTQATAAGSNGGLFIVAPSQDSSTASFAALNSLAGSRSGAINYYKPLAPMKLTASTQQMTAIQTVSGQGTGVTTVSATPASVWFWIIGLLCNDASASTVIGVQVTIEYRVKFSERVPQDLSLTHQLKNRQAFMERQASKPQGPVQFALPAIEEFKTPRTIEKPAPSDDRTETKKPAASKEFKLSEWITQDGKFRTPAEAMDTSSEEWLDDADREELKHLRMWKAATLAASAQKSGAGSSGTSGLSADDFRRLVKTS